ncbi:MAG: hypothetical protein NUV94_02040 [Candidatus Acetothermia bacterium]|jgi:riboflavin kinase/FMN adenylyltransferase|nr:hypothetical protein [Candidatus Acetothermia bacterium]
MGDRVGMGRLVAVGRFDGVHLGHQALFAEGRRLAQERGLILTAYTFPPRGPSLLTLAAKERLLGALADEVTVVRWEQVQDLAPDVFLREELVERLGARGVVLGPDHRFGRGRAGDVGLLRRLSGELGLSVHVVEPLEVDGGAVSSARIRDLLRCGEVAAAARLLGRPPCVVGQPVPGVALARRIGFPTVNLDLAPELLRPREGVYAAWAHWPGGDGGALFYIGKRPTFPGLPPSAEVHLLVPPAGEVPGPVEVHLLRFLRGDERFSDPEALTRRIARDRQEAETVVRATRPPTPLLVG